MTSSLTAGRVLVISSDDEPLTSVEQSLTAAGYDVQRCHRSGAPSFPCAGLVGGECPLEATGGVDVAIDVRHHPWPTPTPRELGVTCALRARVPLVVVTPYPHPFTAWAESTVADEAALVQACDDAVVDALEPARAAVADAVAEVFTRHGLDERAFAVRLERRLGQLRVHLTADAPQDALAMAATRAAVAVRRFDPAATHIDIDVRPPDAAAAQR